MELIIIYHVHYFDWLLRHDCYSLTLISIRFANYVVFYTVLNPILWFYSPCNFSKSIESTNLLNSLICLVIAIFYYHWLFSCLFNILHKYSFFFRKAHSYSTWLTDCLFILFPRSHWILYNMEPLQTEFHFSMSCKHRCEVVCNWKLDF